MVKTPSSSATMVALSIGYCNNVDVRDGRIIERALPVTAVVHPSGSRSEKRIQPAGARLVTQTGYHYAARCTRVGVVFCAQKYCSRTTVHGERVYDLILTSRSLLDLVTYSWPASTISFNLRAMFF